MMRTVLVFLAAVAWVMLLSGVQVVRADCCNPSLAEIVCCLRNGPQCDQYADQVNKVACQDCSDPFSPGFQGKYCGVGKCNIFGCNCDGGCRSATQPMPPENIRSLCSTEVCPTPSCG